MTTSSPGSSDQSNTPDSAAGALLSDEQVRWLRRLVIGMTVVLIAGFALLIGRVIYLARGTGTQATATGTPYQPDLNPEIRAQLSAGAQIKAISATGNRVVILHASPGKADEMSVLDLVTGKIVSHVVIEARQ